ncbi:unnamed protein product [Mucor hiemalis]
MKEDITDKSESTSNPDSVVNNDVNDGAVVDKTANKTRRSKKKKTEPTVAVETEETPTADTKEPKKKRTKSKKKLGSVVAATAVDEENKENTNPEPVNAISKKKTNKKVPATTAVVTAVVDQNNPDGKKDTKKSKKKSQKTREPLSELKVNEEKSYIVDYKGLHDALSGSFSLENSLGDVHFAPLVSKVKKIEKTPNYSLSSSTANGSIDSEGRNSNRSSPTAKNRHAEIAPPSCLTSGSNKKKSIKSARNDKSTIEKIKDSKVKSNGESEKTPPVKTAEKKKKKASTADLGEPVTPVVIKKPTTSKKQIVKEEKREKKAGKKATQEDYCHPNDIIYGKNRVRFERYVDPKVCVQKIQDGKYYEGLIRINKRNRTDAYVTCETLDADIFINGQHDRNRALEGDKVVVELLDLETVWAKKKDSMKQKREERHSTALERPPQEEGEDDKGKPKYVGKVVSITTSNKSQTYSGTLSLQQRFSDGNETVDVQNVRLAWFKPVDTRSPLIAIPLKNAPADILKNEEKYKNLLMISKINRWPIDSSNPFGAVVRELGHIGNIVAETQAVLMDNNIEEKPFRSKALKGLPPTPWSIKQADIDKRRDLRQTRIFTIDPATAKDLDDAVHVTKLGEDSFEVGVHIADVSHFINQHTALDHEAYDRGTSTYLCDRVIPMLPSLLCEELCSLNPGVERLAFSVIWQMDGAGNIKDTWFGKSVIKSCVKLAYEDAQSVIEGKGLPENVSIQQYSTSDVEEDIKFLFKISKQMRDRRFSNGALSINSIRLSFKLNDLGEPCDIAIYEQKDANRLIEEFMLCANMSVAQKISKHYPNEALLRQHAPPHEKSLNEFIKIAENLGYHFDGSSAGSLQKSFNDIKDEDVKTVLRLLAVKPMQRAKYFCTGSCDIIKYRHFALNVPLYTHFTSPIRRFADIIVHRQLEAALSNKESCGYKKDDVQKAAGHCNERKEGAKNSQDMNIQLYLAHYLYQLEEETKKHITSTAIVTQILKDCFEILVPEYGLEKRIHMDALPIERFVHDPHKNALTCYWKEGIESNREWDQNRKLDENYIEPSGTQIQTKAGKSAQDVPQELTNADLIDKDKKSQRFEPFSKITVRIQVNVERSPPVINIYPVNPFM